MSNVFCRHTAKCRVLETFDLKVDGGKPLLLVEFEKMYENVLVVQREYCHLITNLRYLMSQEY